MGLTPPEIPDLTMADLKLAMKQIDASFSHDKWVDLDEIVELFKDDEPGL